MYNTWFSQGNSIICCFEILQNIATLRVLRSMHYLLVFGVIHVTTYIYIYIYIVVPIQVALSY